MGFSQLYANPRVNWMYESEPEAQLGGRTLYQPRGKVLGGTSSINGMVYMRGNAADYDEWRQRGCTGWDWDSVLPYFKKAEHQERGANEFHGVGGPLHVSDQPRRSELADRVVEAAIQAGLPPIEDFNDGRQEGAGYFQSTTGKQPPLEHRHRLSASGAQPRQPRGAPECTRHAHPDRERPRRRRHLRQRRRDAHRTRARRGDRLRRRVQFAAIAATVRHRTRRTVAGDGHSGDPRPAGGRQPSAGPFLRSPGVSAAPSRSP